MASHRRVVRTGVSGTTTTHRGTRGGRTRISTRLVRIEAATDSVLGETRTRNGRVRGGVVGRTGRSTLQVGRIARGRLRLREGRTLRNLHTRVKIVSMRVTRGVLNGRVGRTSRRALVRTFVRKLSS